MLLPAARMRLRLKVSRSHRMQDPSLQAVVPSLSPSASTIRCTAPCRVQACAGQRQIESAELV